MAGTAQVTVGSAAYVSLGNGPMLISPNAPIQIVAAASQPAANILGHPIGPEATTPTFGPVGNNPPFYFSFTEQVWAIAQQAGVNVTVTT